MKAGGQLPIRTMSESEAGDVSALLCRCYAWLGAREGLSQRQIEFLKSERGSLETVRRESGEETYLVAQEGAAILGMIAFRKNRITKLYVDPLHHEAGVGRTLYETAESAIRSQGHTTIELGAFPIAVPFYEAMGLRVVGTKEAGGELAGFSIALMEKRLEG
jgi:ribosomal protein S18 acetylase RimI-like enzyme